jgi:hypothetical protein
MGESWVTSWGTISGKQGRGIRSVMVDFYIFWDVATFFVVEVEPGAEKIRLDLKKVNAPWSL